MIVTKIRVIGLTTIDFPLGRSAKPSDSYITKAVDGLTPPSSSVSISDAKFLGRDTEDREITILAKLNPNYKLGETFESLRRNLYGLLTPADTEAVTVQFLNGDTVTAQVSGYVSKVEPTLFEKEPAAQIVIPCNGAYLAAPAQTSIVPTGKGVFSIQNPGDAPTGVQFELTFTNNLGNGWSITGPRGWKMTFDYEFLAGDILRVSTVELGREVIRVRNGAEKNLAYAIRPSSKWVMLRGGKNDFTASSTLFNWSYFRFTPLYWGI